ncbi:unnamed protein product [Heligmosomoides polygyrus]|uniref:DDE_3 domain-containing protein n=1 Tax=Heligmosomoides polygyrus TaxID=6339 RepID=A0A183FTK1_HELPZ|nr:unnamed protein product [Heligmosomoides polygyrus]
MPEMKRKLLEKYPRFGGIHVSMDNPRPHRAKRTQETTTKESIEIVHPACSPDINPCDYAAFRSLAHFLMNFALNVKKFSAHSRMDRQQASFFLRKCDRPKMS